MSFITALATNSGSVAKFVWKRKDKILLVGGFVCGAAALGTTVKATLKCKDIIEEHKNNMEMIATAAELNEDYANSKDIKTDTIKAYALTIGGVARQVAAPVIFAAGSAACFIGEHAVMENKVEKLTETVVGLSAAYTAIDGAFKKYRKNVINELGKEADERFRTGKIKKTVDVTETNDDGTTTTTKKDIYVVDEPDPSDYAKFFDCTSTQFRWMDAMHYRPDWDDNIHFLNCQLSYANQILQLNGYLFLNDVYEMLGLPKTKAGQVVGWIFDPENPNIDSHVSFGTYELRNREIINHEGNYEYEQCILLDFNVDGPIIDHVNLGEK